eukprot:scaffold8.g1546.t1
MSVASSLSAPQIAWGRAGNRSHWNPKPAAVRRHLLQVQCKGSAADAAAEERKATAGRGYFNVTGYPFPLGPLTERKTIRREIDKGRIWVFEQPQSLGFSNVTTVVRMVVIKLDSGGLWVHAPVAPTTECLRLVRELNAPVEHIILPTFAYEHKIFVGPFSRRFPKAKVYVAPSQWSWPINLPVQASWRGPWEGPSFVLAAGCCSALLALRWLTASCPCLPLRLPHHFQFFGIFPTGVLKDADASTPWAAEIEQKVFKASVGIGPYIEVAFYDKKSRTLLVTDAVVSVPPKAPELVKPRDLVDAAASNFFIRVLSGDEADVPVGDVPLAPTELTPAVADLGWRRMALQILYIVPGDLRTAKSFFEVASRLIVGPILKTLVFSTVPAATRAWIDAICADWPFRRIIPAHFSAPLAATPADLRAAFSFVYEGQEAGGQPAPAGGMGLLAALFRPKQPEGVRYPAEDMAALDAARRFLVDAGVVNRT